MHTIEPRLTCYLDCCYAPSYSSGFSISHILSSLTLVGFVVAVMVSAQPRDFLACLLVGDGSVASNETTDSLFLIKKRHLEEKREGEAYLIVSIQVLFQNLQDCRYAASTSSSHIFGP